MLHLGHNRAIAASFEFIAKKCLSTSTFQTWFKAFHLHVAYVIVNLQFKSVNENYYFIHWKLLLDFPIICIFKLCNNSKPKMFLS